MTTPNPAARAVGVHEDAGRVVAPVARLVDTLIVALAGGGLLAVPVVLTGHTCLAGLTGHGGGYRPVYLAVAGLGILLISAITADVIRLGAANRAAARARRRAREFADGASLPDDVTPVTGERS